MNDFPAIALIEFRSIAAGTFAADAMVKKATVQLLRAGTVQPGKYLVLIGGSTAAVNESYKAGIEAGTPEVIDDVILPQVDRQGAAAIDGTLRTDEYETVAILETSTSAAIVRAADAAVKGAEAMLKELRLANGLGGKGLALLTGSRHDIEAAVEVATAALAGRDVKLCHSIISRIDSALAENIDSSTRFYTTEEGPQGS